MEQRFYSLNDFFKKTYNRKCYKIALNAGMTCPNRDGKCGTRGCIFCSEGGSGDFAVKLCDDNSDSIAEQLLEGKRLFKSGKDVGKSFVAYFQAYTNTYAPVDVLEKLFEKALSTDFVIGISIATRPDCLEDEKIELLKKLKARHQDKFIWVELGLQTIHEKTALFIRRGYPLSVFDETAKKFKKAGIPIIVHVILGLPDEGEKEVLETIDHINSIDPFGIKLQLLHILKHTDLCTLYERGEVTTLSKEEYVNLIVHCIQRLKPSVCIHRITGDGPKDSMVAPMWSLNKRGVLNAIHHRLKETNTIQGDHYNAGNSDSL